MAEASRLDYRRANGGGCIVIVCHRRGPLLPAWLPPLAVAFSSGGSGEQWRLVLYTKPGCCLCEGLKEKIHAAVSLDGPSSIQLQVTDITANPKWERLYQYEIPVLAKIGPDGTEETLPRLSPRLGVELIQKKIATAFEQ